MADLDGKILERLEEWEKREGRLPEALELYRRLLRIQAEARGRVPPPLFSVERGETRAKLQQGIWLLDAVGLPVEGELLLGLFQAVTAVLGEYYQDTSTNLEGLRALASEPSQLEEVVSAWWGGQSLSAWAGPLGVQEGILAQVVLASVRPLMIPVSEALRGLVDQEQWRRGYCPVCGGKPDFAFLDKERGARWLLCSRCDAPWLFQRLQCPFCDTQDQKSLAYFTDDKGLYRLYVCEECRSYLKAIDLRLTDSEILLPLERVLTLDLDRQALEAGYRGLGPAPGPAQV